ncbi:hypothetical protein HHI36_001410 [Cryptolaemus montrouzieri]|uniref:Uncharacterized protein n=1 Tax=Cryptolaemus montrouzieri TaxID=559131 RepID=A0ABD2P8W4_9CUCU
MDFMDIDDDIEVDPIEKFLKNKLEDIKFENAKLKEIYKELKEETERVTDEIEDFSDRILIDKSWIKVVNNKYVIWFHVRNKTNK